MSLPDPTYPIDKIGDIFHRLSKGKFICANATDREVRNLYRIIATDNHFEILQQYYAALYFNLEKGDRFYYFSRRENKAHLENKLQTAIKWLSVMQFINAYNPDFAPNTEFSAEAILTEVYDKPSLGAALKGLAKIIKTPVDDRQKTVGMLIKLLEDDNFIEPLEPNAKQYKVLYAFQYLQNLVLTLDIYNEL